MPPTGSTSRTRSRSIRPFKDPKPPLRLDLPVDPDLWWQAVQDLPETPVVELVDLTRIGKQPIPFSRLPTRARTYYGGDLGTWSDLAQETITTLLARPKAGIGTVRSILMAAQNAAVNATVDNPDDGTVDAPVAVRQLLVQLPARDRTLLSRRWALTPLTIPEVAAKLGVNPATVVRGQPRADARLRDLLADPAHKALTGHAEALRGRLGPLTRPETAGHALADLGLDIDRDEGQLLLFVAGPYRLREGWLEDTTGGLEMARAAIEAALDDHGAPATWLLRRNLLRRGIREDTAVDLINEHPGLRCVDRSWVRWGHTQADRVEAGLHLIGRPATAATIAERIGEAHRRVRVANVLSEDPRFVRVSNKTWALAAWGTEGFGGVFAEIVDRIDAAGGTISVHDIVEEMANSFPDISARSVLAYLHAPAFLVTKGTVRRRTPEDPWPKTWPLNRLRGVYRNGDNEIRFALPVNVELLRGSGQVMAPGLAHALGVDPGQQRTFTNPDDRTAITVTWHLASTQGASIGSLRELAAKLQAQRGDTLVLVFRPDDTTVTAACIADDASPQERLELLLGRPGSDPVTALAEALSCLPEEVHDLLDRRGEIQILDPELGDEKNARKSSS